MMLQSIPRDQWRSVELKVIAKAALNGKRKDYGLKRRWDGDYLSQVRMLYLREYIVSNRVSVPLDLENPKRLSPPYLFS